MPTDSDYRNLGPPRTHHFDSPHAGAQAQITLFGPFVVDYTDIPHDGDTKELWTPRVGDVLLALAADWRTLIEGQQGGANFNNGGISFGPSDHPQAFANGMDFAQLFLGRVQLPWTFTSTAAVQARHDAYGDADWTAGHLDLYALVARAIAP